MGMFDFITKRFVSRQQFESVAKKLEIYAKTAQPQARTRQLFRQQNEIAEDDIELLANNSDIILIIHKALRSELLRNGFDVIESNKSDAETTDSEDAIVEVSEDDRKRILEFIECCNDKKQSLSQVMSRLEDDINTFDRRYALYVFEYSYVGNDFMKKLVGIDRIDPRVIYPLINQYEELGKDDSGNFLYFDPAQRNRLIEKKEKDETLFPAWYVTNFGEQNYYAPWEVDYHVRYRPSRYLGYSPIVTLYYKIQSLLSGDKYIMELYTGKRPPKGMLVFSGVNPETLKKAWEDMVEKAQTSPHAPAILGLPSNLNGSGGKQGEYFDFMRSLQDLQFVEQRDEFRRIIGGVYGVSPVFQNDVSTSGGLNNEGLQITVTNRAVENNQSEYNNGLLKNIVNYLNTPGYILKLRPSEEQDEMARLTRQDQSLRNGETAVRLGLEAEYDDLQGEVIIKSGKIQSSSTLTTGDDAFGGFGGTMPQSGSPDVEAASENDKSS